MTGILRLVLTGLLVLSLCACGSESNDTSQSGKGSLRSLVESDLADLGRLDSSTIQVYDSGVGNGRFAQLFGGTSGSDVQRFFSKRLKYIVTENDEVRISPSRFRYDAWLSNFIERHDSLVADSDREVVVGAANIGTLFWLLGVVNDTPVTLVIRGEEVLLDSSREGVMLLGPGYRESETLENRREIKLPPAFRQQILVHEARHSDCTAELTEDDLEIIRRARNTREFDRTFTKRQCGHLHVTCPGWHDLAGEAACDSEPWGAYTVGAVFGDAIRHSPGLSRLDQEILRIVTLDSKSRVILERGASPDRALSLYESMIQFGETPDMSSWDLVRGRVP